MDGINIGEEARLHYTIKENVQNTINKIIDSLKSFGLKNEDIVILSCKSETNNSLQKTNCLNKDGNYKIGDGFIKFSTCRKFKGLEAEAIIITDLDGDVLLNGDKRLLFYVGASRAKFDLNLVFQVALHK